jgi:hypothetical protein
MNHMERKTVITLFLILGICLNGLMAEFCFCGQTCLHGLQSKSKIKVNSLFHLRCQGTLCKSCNLEKGQTLKEANSANQALDVKTRDTGFILSTLPNYPSTNYIFKDFDLFYTYITVPSSPIYLIKLSLRC